MAKGSQQRPARQKKDTSGCMWGIIGMFDFRYGRISRRLLSDHKRYSDNNTHGPPYPISKANLPTSSPEMHPPIIEDGARIIKSTFDHMIKRVKEVTEEKMFINDDPKSVTKKHEHVNISKTLKNYFDEEILISHEAQKTSEYHDLEALVKEILLIYRKRNQQVGDLGTGAKRSFPIVKEKIIAAVEALLNEKSRNGEYKKFHHLKEMFQVLSSNKEMFLKMLQDQNLILLNEDQKSKSKDQESEEPFIPKRRKIFRRSSRSQESTGLYEKDRIVILKPGCSENEQQFSFMKVRRPNERAGRMVDGGWSSPNRDHFYTERFSKITNTFKTGLSKSHETGVKVDNAENRISNIYVEAKKHLSEMLTSSDEDAESMKRSLPKSLGRILSLENSSGLKPTVYEKGYNSLSPGTSPRGQPRPMVNKSQLITTNETPEGENEVLDDLTCEERISSEIHYAGEQEIVKLPFFDPHDSLYEDKFSESLESSLPEKNNTKKCNELSLAGKTDDHEISPGKPSPASVLEPLFSNDEITPARTISLPVKHVVQPRSIQFENFVSCAENQQIRITDSGNNEESAFEYVEAVLLSSDLNWSKFETRWLSSVQILDPSLFDELGTFSGRAKYDQKFLFDSTNEALEDVCNCFIPDSLFIKRNVRPVPRGMDLINVVWSRLESCLDKLYPRDLNELVRTELETSRLWVDLQTGSREVVIALQESMFEELIDDIVFGLFI